MTRTDTTPATRDALSLPVAKTTPRGPEAIGQRQGRRRLSRTAFLAAAVVVLFAVSVLLGSYTVTIPDFFTIVINHLTGGEKIPGASFIVMEHKLPRAVIGTMIGIAFGLAGALFQTMLRNPLASPDIIGISYGASAAAVTAIVIFGASGAVVSGAALAGALGVAAIIYAISRGGSGAAEAAAATLPATVSSWPAWASPLPCTRWSTS